LRKLKSENYGYIQFCANFEVRKGEFRKSQFQKVVNSGNFDVKKGEFRKYQFQKVVNSGNFDVSSKTTAHFCKNLRISVPKIY
jgi:hypothetical protein